MFMTRLYHPLFAASFAGRFNIAEGSLFMKEKILVFTHLSCDFKKSGVMALFFLLGFVTISSAQKSQQIEIVKAGSLEGSKSNGVEVRRLVGDVVFKQEDTYMYCDSALFFEATNSIDAFGTIRIEGPKAKLYGDVLHYDGNKKQAVITGKEVRMTDDKMVLTTTAMNYDLANNIGHYSTGGRVVESQNVLTSRQGYYYSNERMLFFKDSVELTNPKYVMNSDTLKYNTTNSQAYFFGPSTIRSLGSDSTFIYCENGWYNTKTEKSYFSKNAYVQAKENRLKGDSVIYDRQNGIGRAWNNVQVSDSVQKMIIEGDYAILDEKQGTSFVTGKSMLTKIFETDSLFMHADTLYASQDSATKEKKYFAYHHTRIFKTDLQGQCDSLIYSTGDSTLWFYGAPILWNNKNQLTADLIYLKIADNKLSTLNLSANAFIAGQEDSLRFNQVKGRDMTGFFIDNKLTSIKVTGNGQTVYYLRNKKKQLTGVNKADCSDMMIYLGGNSIQKISLLNRPDATLFPVKELSPNELKLKGFEWLGGKQPKNKEDIFIWNE
ncbi:OstA-like protein [soil metagenome]